ncbi:MAG: hypothetical protein LBK98_04700 [Peptococcaceae bacterium]|nr:hypothetical protein [Peptococcaceae bacterium]
MGNVIEHTAMFSMSNGCPCRKINADDYVNLQTGEILPYRHIEDRSGSERSIRKTLSRIRDLINTNITVPENCRWITLTYRENMTDSRRLYKDYEKFWKRFIYYCSRKVIPKPEYISVVEPQGRGAWHVHAFFIWREKAPFISNDALAALWRFGFVKIKAVKGDVDNVGAYFTAYLGDIPLEEVDQIALDTCSVEEKEFEDELGVRKKKKFVKGGRLRLYPPGMNILRCSCGVARPISEWLTYKEASEKASAATETFSRTYEIMDDDGEKINTITKKYFNTKRRE